MVGQSHAHSTTREGQRRSQSVRSCPRDLLREARRRSHGGYVSGYSNASLSLVFTARSLSHMQSANHTAHGLAPTLPRPPCKGWFHGRRQLRFASSRVPRQGSPPTPFRTTTASPRKRRSKGLSRMKGNFHVRF